MEKKEGNKLYHFWIWTFELAKGIFIFLAILVLIHFFIATVFVVEGISMEPNFHDGQYILIEKITYLIGELQRGDPIVIKFPGDPENKKYIKRIIALPNETVEIKDNKVYINNERIDEFYITQFVKTLPDMKMTLANDEYFLLGDNRENSNDSRVWGACPKKDIIGRAVMILLPFSDISLMPHVEY